MGQSAGAATSCAFSSVHLCAQDAPTASLVLPSQCTASQCSSAGEAERVTQIYCFDPTSASRFPSSGLFSVVLKAVHRSCGDVRAIRVVPRKRCDRERLVPELDLLIKLEHPNLARVYEYFVADDSKMICICMEYIESTDLLSVLTLGEKPGSVRPSRWPEREVSVAGMIKQILLALQQLHGMSIAHGDVHPRNIVVCEGQSSDGLRLKLIDYGLSAKYAKGSSNVFHDSRCHHCVAPERVVESMSVKAPSPPHLPEDLWAVGTIMFLLLSKHWPFEAELPDLLQKKIRMAFWSFLPAEAWTTVTSNAKKLVTSLLSVSSIQRLNVTQALSHTFFTRSFSEFDLHHNNISNGCINPLKSADSPSLTSIMNGPLKLAAGITLTRAIADALASKLSVAALEDFRQHFLNRDSTNPSLSALRRALASAEVSIPGYVLYTVLAVEKVSPEADLNLQIDSLVETAIVRRCALEEVLLWVAWSCAFPGCMLVNCSDLEKLLALGGPALASLSGTALKNAAEGFRTRNGASPSFSTESEPLRSRVSFDELLTWLQSSRHNRGKTRRKSSGREGRASSRISSRGGSNLNLETELELYIPPMI